MKAGLSEQVLCIRGKNTRAGDTALVKAGRWDKPGESGEQRGGVRGARGEERLAGRISWTMRGPWVLSWGLGKSGEDDCIYFKLTSRWEMAEAWPEW